MTKNIEENVLVFTVAVGEFLIFNVYLKFN